jgi:hypothetical protein
VDYHCSATRFVMQRASPRLILLSGRDRQFVGKQIADMDAGVVYQVSWKSRLFVVSRGLAIANNVKIIRRQNSSCDRCG